MNLSRLRAKDISKTYKNKKIVDNISIDIQQGEIKGILGPNGAGKSTSFHMLSGIIKPDSGSIMLNDRDITKYKLPKRAKLGIGYLPQESSIFLGLSIEDNIKAALEFRKDLKKNDINEKLEHLINKFQLQRIRKTPGALVSGGERRRTEVARTLALDPIFVLLDEPFAGIDPVSISEIKEIILEIKNNNIGVIITDHNVRETLKICDSADIMNKGQLIASGKPKSILANDMVKKVYLGNDFDIS